MVLVAQARSKRTTKKKPVDVGGIVVEKNLSLDGMLFSPDVDTTFYITFRDKDISFRATKEGFIQLRVTPEQAKDILEGLKVLV